MKIIILIFCCCLLGVPLSGCVGLALIYTAECENETPVVDIHNSRGSKIKKTPPWSTKDEFMNKWGKPDEIKSISSTEELWIYERHLWCGAMPCLGVCVPLVLPVCNGFDRIYFRGDNAWRLHSKDIATIVGIAAVTPMSAGAGGSHDAVCRHPIPKPLNEKVQPGKTAYLYIHSDSPEEAEYYNVSKLLEKHLSSELIVAGVFKAIDPTAKTAEYFINVKIKDADFDKVKNPRYHWEWYSWNHTINMTVQIYNLGTHQPIGEYDLREAGAPDWDKIHEEPDPYSTESLNTSIQAVTELIIRSLKGEFDLSEKIK